jgi:hypothetical protein
VSELGGRGLAGKNGHPPKWSTRGGLPTPKKKFQIGITVMVNNAHPHQTVVGSEKKVWSVSCLFHSKTKYKQSTLTVLIVSLHSVKTDNKQYIDC